MKKLIIVLLSIIAFSCGKKGKVPDYVIPQDDMINIIIDIHITDGLLTVKEIRRDLTRNDSIDYYKGIFVKYGYSREEFDSSIYFYSKNINKYDEIYAEVLNQLNEMETELIQEENKDNEEIED